MNQNYRPSDVQFEVLNQNLPESLGVFENFQTASVFLHENTIAVSGKSVRVNRFIDYVEKSELRKDYGDLLELKLPFIEIELQKAENELNEAKKKVKDITQQVEGTIAEIRALAIIVKNGVKEINLDGEFTCRIATNGKYAYYTFIDNKLKLCKVEEIPQHEKSEIFNDSKKNTTFLDSINNE